MLFGILTPVLLDELSEQPAEVGIAIAVAVVVWTVTMLGLAFVFYRWLFRTIFRR